ncbi:hypothetical protein DOK47_01550, partial [Campylobacter jejuni]|nr:hypothetical protein [Campylobacter jejuni]EAL3473788.1 hypothetical protein [Campylobacter jejuni]EAL4583934.1 hypothetical protein [Campylobacter jejuni]EAL4957554.1 hypothetical protein [Campylobacter jejuni]
IYCKFKRPYANFYDILKKNTIPFLYFSFKYYLAYFCFLYHRNTYTKNSKQRVYKLLNVLLDSYAFITATFKSQLSGVGLIIMSVAGFTAYMKHINASAKLAFLANKPSGKIKK